MLYIIGSKQSALEVAERLPDEVVSELIRGAAFLDDEYGEERDFAESGGYSIVAEDEADLPDVKARIDYDRHPCEWATVLGKSGYCSALYVMNDDFSIMLYLPITCAPDAVLRELEP